MKHPSYRTCDVCGKRLGSNRYRRVRDITEIFDSRYTSIKDVCDSCWGKLENMAVREESHD